MAQSCFNVSGEGFASRFEQHHLNKLLWKELSLGQMCSHQF